MVQQDPPVTRPMNLTEVSNNKTKNRQGEISEIILKGIRIEA